jgi:hypothetical protein
MRPTFLRLFEELLPLGRHEEAPPSLIDARSMEIPMLRRHVASNPSSSFFTDS